ncbi:MAG TPA: histidine kinase dimerization/phospho-acceptor domain-containing protein, partial [Chthoniobacterales bacterium]
MNSGIGPILVALVIQVGLGVVVFQSNPKRQANQAFLLLTATIALWGASFGFAFSAQRPIIAEWAIREANATGILIAATFNILRLSISGRSKTWRGTLLRSRTWLLLAGATILLCQTKWFMSGVRMPQAVYEAPAPIYGPGIYVYTAMLGVGVLALLFGSWRDLRATSGAERAELAYLIIGGVSALGIPLLITVVVEPFWGHLHFIWLAPFRVAVFTAIVAYGIATRKVMDVGLLLRRVISYTLLTLYLLTVYGLVWWLVATALHPMGTQPSHSFAHIIAAIAIAFAMAPARGISQRLAERLFISTQRVDFGATMNKAATILSSVTTLDDLLKRFATTIAEAVKTERIAILLHSRDRFEQAYALQASQTTYPTVSLSENDPMVRYLRNHHGPIVLDELQRQRETAEIEEVMVRMRSLKLAVVVGIFARDLLTGVMFLGPRTSGRIYGSTEQNALEVLCGQLAIAIDNAELFTEAQNAKIYNETLLEKLTSGVIAASADERITVFNNEVERITGLDSRKLLDRSVDFLPDALRCALRETLQTGQGVVNGDITLNNSEGQLSIRVSTSIFHGRDGGVLGALAVLTDITALKRLEFQIRRSDRLASLGTLSAGMAHEIKNPLVSIKTFAQLLPERYQDSDFRETFSNLIGHEIDRIDSLVNQLLRFARPAKPQLEPKHVHQ